MPAPVLQFKRGAYNNLPGLRAGEPGFTTDKYDLYVGLTSNTTTNKFFGSGRYWGREDGTTSLRFNLVDKDGTNYVTIKSPDTLAGIVTYSLPGTQGISGTVLTNDGSGNLSWASGSNNATFTGITTFSDTTDSTTKDNGAVILEGGLGVEKSVNIGGNLSVTGVSTFNGLVVENNGMNVSGFSTIYNLHVTTGLNVGGTLDLDGVLNAGNDALFAGISSFTNTTESTTYQDGAVVLDGGLGVGKNVNIHGNLKVDGNVTIGGTFISLKGQDVYIENKDIILGFTTSITPNDDTANHAGVAIASTIGTPLTSFSATGINTLPDTYKQLMWFKSGTLGFSTDTFAFNYGLAIGTTTMANGVRLAVGSGVTVSDTTVSATTFFAAGVDVTGIATVGTLKLSGTSGIGITGISTSTTLAENSNNYLPTQAAVKAYVDAVDVTLGLNADTGGPSTVSTSQTLTISGTANEVETSVSGQTVSIGLPNTVVVGTALSAPTVNANYVKASDGTNSITINNGTGNVGISSNLTVNGDLFVLGTTTEVNTESLKVQDPLVDLGLIDNGSGQLIPPTSDLGIDLGVLLNWYDGSAKKASVFWDDSASRIGIASDVSELNNILTVNNYAAVEIGSLWVTDCAGTSKVITCTGSERFLENITIDAGTF